MSQASKGRAYIPPVLVFPYISTTLCQDCPWGPYRLTQDSAVEGSQRNCSFAVVLFFWHFAFVDPALWWGQRETPRFEILRTSLRVPGPETMDMTQYIERVQCQSVSGGDARKTNNQPALIFLCFVCVQLKFT